MKKNNIDDTDKNLKTEDRIVPKVGNFVAAVYQL